MIGFEVAQCRCIAVRIAHAGAHGDRFNRAAGFVHRHNVMPVQKFCATRNAALGQRLGEDAGIAAFVARGVGAAHNMLGKGFEGGLDFEQLIAAHQLAGHAIFAHQRGCIACRVEGFLVGKKVRNAAFKPLVINAGAAHHVFQRIVAVGTQGDNLLHIALERRVIALRQKFHAPQPLVPAISHGHARAKQQWRIVTKHPFERFERCVPIRPRLAIAHRDLRRIGKAGFHGGIQLALHHDHLMPALQQVPSRAHADDACAQNDDFHAPQCRSVRFSLTAI